MDNDSYIPNNRSGYNQRGGPSSTYLPSQPYVGSVASSQTPRDSTPLKTTHKYAFN